MSREAKVIGIRRLFEVIVDLSWVETPVLFFHRLWTKVHQIKCACAGVIVVCNAVSD